METKEHTRNQEAVTDIFKDYLNPDQIAEITNRLENEGQRTRVDFIKLSESYTKNDSKWITIGKAFLCFVVAFHGLVVFFNLLACFVLPFVVQWYIALPIITLIVNLTFSPISCPLTRLESRIRRSIGLPEVRHFMKYYVIDPIRRLVGKQ